MDNNLSLAEYDKIALKLIYKYCKRNGHIYVSDELIGRIVYWMARADQKYDSKKSSLSRESYRRMYGICAIREYLKPPKRKYYPLPYNVSTRDISKTSDKNVRKINFLIDNGGLSQREFTVMRQFLSGRDISTISEDMGITTSTCSKIYKRSINKLRRISNEK